MAGLLPHGVAGGVLYSTLTGEDGNLYYNLPLGEDIPAGLRQCLTRHPERPVRFCTIPEAELPLFRALPGRVEITEEENFADYLYSAEEMIRLSGKKFSGQRSFEPLDNTDAAEVETFFHTLNKKLNYTPGEAAEENHKVQEVLEHLDQYGLVGGVLRADGAIVGFTLGEVLRDTLYIHIEKADRDYPGAYQMLCRQFCTAYADGLAYVNREEDMGDLGLRKAKRDLHPVTQLKKYTVEVW